METETVFRVIDLPENRGHGNASREALKHCSYPLAARMDADDISAPYRFQKQLDVFQKAPDVDIVGGSITEFVGTPDNITGERAVELTDKAIKADLKKRCPMNHMTTMYKVHAVQAAGGYLDWYCDEDYYLWVRMAENGCKFANVPYPLVNVRTGADMSARRGGWKYFQSEWALQKYMLEHKLIRFPRYLYNVAIRFGGEVLAPNSIRRLLFKFVRKKFNPFAAPTLSDNDASGAYPPFSVIMSVYAKDDPAHFDTALESVFNQTVKPSEIVLVVDGAIPDSLRRVVDKYAAGCKEI